MKGDQDGRELNDNTSPWRTNAALGIIGTSFVGTIALISPFVTPYMANKVILPYMATPRTKVIKALEFIAKRKQNESSKIMNSSKLAKSKQHLRYYDLGSGDGETVLAAASLNWKATGIELNGTLWALSLLRKLRSPSNVRSQCNLVWGNLWAHSIHDADAVMIFGVKPLMPKIAKKISDECQPGTYVMSYRFLIPCKQVAIEGVTDHMKGENQENSKLHAKEELPGKLDATLIYDQEEMRIYQLSQ